MTNLHLLVERFAKSLYRTPAAAGLRPLVKRFFKSLLFVFLLLVSCQPADTSWQTIQQRGVLRVGLDPTYPPFEAGNGELHGFDIDLARALATDLGLKVEFVLFGYDGLYDALDTEQVDMLISALVIHPERTRDFAYSEPYFNAGQVLVVPAGSPLQTVTDLAGQSVAVELGAAGHVIASEQQRRQPSLTIQPYQTPDEALAAVATGEADAALIDSISAYLYLAAHPDAGLEVSPRPVTVEPFVMVVRIEDETLLEQLNHSLARLEQNGRMDEIWQTWFGRPVPP